MGRTVICLEGLVEEDGRTRITIRVIEPQHVPDGGILHPLTCDTGAPPFLDLAAAPAGNQKLGGPLVKDVGEAVLAGLGNHPGIQHALNEAIAADPNDTWPIYIQTNVPLAESFPVEVLYHPNEQFLSLNDRWPIARMTGGDSTPIARFLDPPLRIAAVLAAHDVPAVSEWEALKDAIEGSNLPCSVVVYVAENALKAHIEGQGLDWAFVDFVPDDEDALIGSILNFRPHLLHMFCHGTADGGYLQVSTPQNLLAGKEPLFLSADNFRPLYNTPWLVTLSACEGAMHSTNAHSIAFSLVSRGIPAAIGMREAVSSASAHKFAGSFYSELLKFLHDHAQPGKFLPMRWAQLMRAPRSALCPEKPVQECARERKDWTLPVLYRRCGDLTIACLDTNAQLDDQKIADLSMLVTYLDMRARLHPDTPQAGFDQLDVLIQGIMDQLGLTAD